MDFSNIQNVAGGMSPSDVEEMMRWAAERERLLKVDPLNYGFAPHEGQMRLHTATTEEVFLVAANRWGKSVAGMRETLWRATGMHPYKKLARQHDVIWCGFVDFGFYIKVTKRLFDDWVPQNRLIQFHESEKWAKIKRSDGGVCTIHFLSYESGRMSWQGGAVDYIWLDEELPQEIYHEATARLVDRRGHMLLTQTPVTGLGWAYDEIYVPAMTGQRPHTTIVQGALASRDDAKPYGVGESLVPHLSVDQIIRLAKASRDEDERAIRVFGEFRGRSGGVYKAFDPSIHVIPSFRIPRYFEVWGGLDPGYHGFAAVMFAQDPQGRVYVPLEFFSQQENHSKRINALWEKVQSVFELDEDDYFIFYCDTANPQDILELNTWSQNCGARMAFTSLEQGLKAREAGIQRVQQFLQPIPGRATPNEVDRPTPEKGEPTIYFFDNLNSEWTEDEDRVATSRLLWEIQRLVWARTSRKKAHPTEADEKSAGGAHALAALRYGLMARIGAPEEPEDENEDYMDPKIRAHIERLEQDRLAQVQSVDDL